ncbi:MAG: lysophospholipid acyltransferase family protein [Alphaproteobacteria bacterium]
MYAARALWCLTAVTGLTLLLLPLQLVFLLLRHPLATTLPVRYHRGVARILGLDVRVLGTRAAGRSVLYVVNHSSWLDIVVLSTVLPGRFVAKKEVAKWPVVGILAWLQRTVFVARERHGVSRHRDELVACLETGDSLILFPEGTSSDGMGVLRFKSALFAVAEKPIAGASLCVQPISLAYTKLNGMPLGRHMRPFFTWYGDMSLGGHLWRALGLGPLTAVVQLHAPVRIEEHASRKEMAAHCQGVVAAGLSAALAGRVGWADEDGARATAGRGVALPAMASGAPES